MSRHTLLAVRLQHIALMAGLVWSLLMPPHMAVVCVLAGVVAFLLLSAPRWKRGAPAGTTRPAELGPPVLRQVAGGVHRDRSG